MDCSQCFFSWPAEITKTPRIWQIFLFLPLFEILKWTVCYKYLCLDDLFWDNTPRQLILLKFCFWISNFGGEQHTRQTWIGSLCHIKGPAKTNWKLRIQKSFGPIVQHNLDPLISLTYHKIVQSLFYGYNKNLFEIVNLVLDQ